MKWDSVIRGGENSERERCERECGKRLGSCAGCGREDRRASHITKQTYTTIPVYTTIQTYTTVPTYITI